MSEPALVVSQSGQVTDGLVALVSAQGYEPVRTLVAERPEDNESYLSPATIDRVEQRRAAAGTDSLHLVVDGSLHPGQAVDLQARVPAVTLRDKRAAVWERLAAANPVAATRLELRQARLDRREAAAAQRDSAERGPSGTSGRLAACENRIENLRSTLDERRRTARERVETRYDGVDGSVVLLGQVGAPTTALWTALTGAEATPTAGRPAQPATTTTTLGPHTLAVTDTPGVPGHGRVPDWLTAAVPGLPTALTQASCVLCVGDGCEPLCDTIHEQFDATCRSVASATPAPARDALRDLFETVAVALRLPYTDATHALVSDLHDRATVHETMYDDMVYVHVEVSRTAAAELRRRASAVGGDVRSLDGE